MTLRLIAALAFIDVLAAGIVIIMCVPLYDYYGMQRRLRLACLMFAVGYAVLLGIKLGVKAGIVRVPERGDCNSSGENAAETRAGSWRAPESL